MHIKKKFYYEDIRFLKEINLTKNILFNDIINFCNQLQFEIKYNLISMQFFNEKCVQILSVFKSNFSIQMNKISELCKFFEDYLTFFNKLLKNHLSIISAENAIHRLYVIIGSLINNLIIETNIIYKINLFYNNFNTVQFNQDIEDLFLNNFFIKNTTLFTITKILK